MNPKAILWTVGLFVVEVLIALYVRDAIIRPYGGDFLATIFVYTGLRSVFRWVRNVRLAGAAFAISTFVELIQLFKVPTRFGWDNYDILRIGLGTTFQWGDLLAYALGAAVAWTIDERTNWITTSHPAEST